jgi:hypothetical protein
MKIPPPDPIVKFARKSKRQRQTGNKACRHCGEVPVAALIRNTGICTQCSRRKKGHTIMDKHHIAGKSNSPVTIGVPANDHRAILSEAQRDWPKATLENRAGCPLRAAAACLRGFFDTALYMFDSLLRWIIELLEILSTILVERLGPKWWLDTPLSRFGKER